MPEIRLHWENESYIHNQNKNLLTNIGLNETQANKALINISLATRTNNKKVFLIFPILVVLILFLICINPGDVIVVYLFLIGLYVLLFVIMIIVELIQSESSRKILDHVLNENLNQLQTAYHFSGTFFGYVVGNHSSLRSVTSYPNPTQNILLPVNMQNEQVLERAIIFRYYTTGSFYVSPFLASHVTENESSVMNDYTLEFIKSYNKTRFNKIVILVGVTLVWFGIFCVLIYLTITEVNFNKISDLLAPLMSIILFFVLVLLTIMIFINRYFENKRQCEYEVINLKNYTEKNIFVYHEKSQFYIFKINARVDNSNRENFDTNQNIYINNHNYSQLNNNNSNRNQINYNDALNYVKAIFLSKRRNK